MPLYLQHHDNENIIGKGNGHRLPKDESGIIGEALIMDRRLILIQIGMAFGIFGFL
jgi:hypothetical protein